MMTVAIDWYDVAMVAGILLTCSGLWIINPALLLAAVGLGVIALAMFFGMK